MAPSKLMKEHLANCSHSNEKKHEYLFLAIEQNEERLVKDLIRLGADPLKICSNKGRCAFDLAEEKGHLDWLDFSFEQGSKDDRCFREYANLFDLPHLHEDGRCRGWASLNGINGLAQDDQMTQFISRVKNMDLSPLKKIKSSLSVFSFKKKSERLSELLGDYRLFKRPAKKTDKSYEKRAKRLNISVEKYKELLEQAEQRACEMEHIMNDIYMLQDSELSQNDIDKLDINLVKENTSIFPYDLNPCNLGKMLKNIPNNRMINFVTRLHAVSLFKNEAGVYRFLDANTGMQYFKDPVNAAKAIKNAYNGFGSTFNSYYRQNFLALHIYEKSYQTQPKKNIYSEFTQDFEKGIFGQSRSNLKIGRQWLYSAILNQDKDFVKKLLSECPKLSNKKTLNFFKKKSNFGKNPKLTEALRNACNFMECQYYFNQCVEKLMGGDSNQAKKLLMKANAADKDQFNYLSKNLLNGTYKYFKPNESALKRMFQKLFKTKTYKNRKNCLKEDNCIDLNKLNSNFYETINSLLGKNNNLPISSCSKILRPLVAQSRKTIIELLSLTQKKRLEALYSKVLTGNKESVQEFLDKHPELNEKTLAFFKEKLSATKETGVNPLLISSLQKTCRLIECQHYFNQSIKEEVMENFWPANVCLRTARNADPARFESLSKKLLESSTPLAKQALTPSFRKKIDIMRKGVNRLLTETTETEETQSSAQPFLPR